MILNGEHQSSKTVLNGKPLNAYDRAKIQNERHHRLIHRQLSMKYRTPRTTQRNRRNNDDISKGFTIIVCVAFSILFLMVMGSIISSARMVSQ